MDESGLLSIGDLAGATDVSASTLRGWEARFGFPDPIRLAGGHRRYTHQHVGAVEEIGRRRRAGIGLEAALLQVRAEMHVMTRPSVFAAIREAHPELLQQLWRQPTLLAVSRAIEDEIAASAPHAHLFGGFQHLRHYRASRDRWVDLARTAASTHVFADLSSTKAGPSVVEAGSGEPVLVALPPAAPMVREWFVICDAPRLHVALLASEQPGQSSVPQRERALEAVWTVDPSVVRNAARRCAETASAAGSTLARDLLIGPLRTPARERHDRNRGVERLVQRMLSYLESGLTSDSSS